MGGRNIFEISRKITNMPLKRSDKRNKNIERIIKF